MRNKARDYLFKAATLYFLIQKLLAFIFLISIIPIVTTNKCFIKTEEKISYNIKILIGTILFLIHVILLVITYESIIPEIRRVKQFFGEKPLDDIKEDIYREIQRKYLINLRPKN